MTLECERAPFGGVLLITAPRFGDERGHFVELHHQGKHAAIGLPEPMVQTNTSRSHRGVLRGLHYQLREPQGKLVSVLRGEIFDVAVDIRHGSPTFGQWFGALLSEANHQQMFIPGGLAHGFCVLSAEADVVFGCTALYDPADERGVLWNDPVIGIDWPCDEPLLSAKDIHQPRLGDLRPQDLPPYH